MKPTINWYYLIGAASFVCLCIRAVRLSAAAAVAGEQFFASFDIGFAIVMFFCVPFCVWYAIRPKKKTE